MTLELLEKFPYTVNQNDNFDKTTLLTMVKKIAKLLLLPKHIKFVLSAANCYFFFPFDIGLDILSLFVKIFFLTRLLTVTSGLSFWLMLKSFQESA